MSSAVNATGVIQSDAPTYLFLGVQMRVLLSSQQTGGQFSLVEGVMPPGGDGGLHIHLREDESMFVIEGAFEVTIGDQVATLEAGASYFAPRGVPQRLRNRGAVPARGVVVTTPGGFDEFVAKAGAPVRPGAAIQPPAPPTPEEVSQLLKLAESFGIQILEAPN